MATFCITTPDPEPKPLDIGEQLAADIRRRIRELESRYPGALTSADRRELQRLAVIGDRPLVDIKHHVLVDVASILYRDCLPVSKNCHVRQ